MPQHATPFFPYGRIIFKLKVTTSTDWAKRMNEQSRAVWTRKEEEKVR